MEERFRGFASRASHAAGTWQAFCLALLLVAVWLVAGLWIGFTDTFYQLLINTGTTIVTFLMVFLIQNTQNRDAKAIHLKLDELLRALKSARNTLIDVEEATDEDLATLEAQFRALREGRAQARAAGARAGDGRSRAGQPKRR
jgi:low affinity Fe/Cu permease